MLDKRVQHGVIIETAGRLSMNKVQHQFQPVLCAFQL
jgi:hypothetical protein